MNDEKEWNLERHKQRSPQLKKTLEHQDRQYNTNIILVIIGIIIGVSITHYYYSLSSKDFQNVKKEIIEENRKQLQEYDSKRIKLKLLDNVSIESLIEEESGYSIKEIQKKAEQLRDFSDSYYDIGLSYSVQGNFDKAIYYYNKSLEINPNSIATWFSKSNLLFNNGDFEEALISIENALKIEPRNTLALSNKGVILFELGKFDQALFYYNKSIEINPNDAGVWYNKGIILNNLNRHQEAVLVYDKATSLNPFLVEAWNNKAYSFNRIRKPEKTIQTY